MAENKTRDKMLLDKLLDRMDERRLAADVVAAMMIVVFSLFLGVALATQVGVGMLATNVIGTILDAMANGGVTPEVMFNDLRVDLTASFAVVAVTSAIITLCGALFAMMVYNTLRAESKEDKKKLIGRG